MTDVSDVKPDSLNIRHAIADKEITLIYASKVLDPSVHLDGRLAGKCLALRNPTQGMMTDYYSLWIDWLAQGENAGAMRAVDVRHLRAEWESYRPVPMTHRQKMDATYAERMLDKVAEHQPEEYRSLRDQRLERMLRPTPRERVQIRMKRLHEDAIMPTLGTDGAACFDIYAIAEYDGEAYINSTEHPSVTCETGWAFEVPEGWVLKVYSRSGQGFKDNTRLANCVGIIDSDYRGPLRVKLTRDDGGTLFVRAGERVAQAMLVRAPVMELIEIGEDEHLSITSRGEQGYGSTGR